MKQQEHFLFFRKTFLTGCLFLISLMGWGQISISSTNTSFAQSFDGLASTGTSATMPTGWYFSETGSNANTNYTVGTGSSNAGDTYSFGALANTERSLGTLQSGNLISTIGAEIFNTSNYTISTLSISYTGEQWRLGTASRVDRLDFQYSLNATSLTTGTWIDVDLLDFTAPITTGVVRNLDGNLTANKVSISNIITGLSISNNTKIWIRWNDFNSNGADDGLAIDDFTIIANKDINYWIGTTSNSWNTSTNWSLNHVPTSTESIIISSNGSNAPLLDVDATISSGKSITISSTGTLTINSGRTLTIAGTADFGGKLVTFKSDASGSGRLGQVAGTLTGATNVKVERYIAQGKRAYRFLAPGVTTTNFISNNWQQATHITGSTTGALGFDQTATGNPSMYTYNNNQSGNLSGWTAIANTNATILEAEKGYRMLVRGDRTPTLITTGSSDNMNTAITLSATGTLKTGTVTISASSSPTAINNTNNTTTNGFSLVANPYVSPIDWLSVTKTGLDGYYYVWDTNVGTAAQRGRYVSYSSGVNNYGGTGISTVNNIIQAGQAFFVKNTTLGTAGTLTFNESNKASTSPFVLRTNNQNTLLSVLLYAPTELALGGYPIDGITTVFGADFDNQIGNGDVPKLESAGENLAWFIQSKKLDINAQAPAAASDVLAIKSLRLGANKSYTFRIKATNFDTSLTGYLVDNYLNTQLEIDMSQDYFATFSTTSDALSFGEDRFKIIFSTSLNNKPFESKGLSIYPNPVVDNQFTIQLPTSVSGKLVVKIHNTLGQEIYQTQTDATNTLLVNPKQALATGVYIVSVNCDGKEYNQKIMVK